MKIALRQFTTTVGSPNAEKLQLDYISKSMNLIVSAIRA